VRAHYRNCPHPGAEEGYGKGGKRANVIEEEEEETAVSASGGRRRWSVEEECAMMDAAHKHIVLGGNGRHHVDWEAVANSMKAGGFERSSTAIRAHHAHTG
jgi:hypothetical protein